MRLQTIGGLAGLICAATYLFGFVFLVMLLAPMGYGAAHVDARAVVGFIGAQSGLMILFNTVIYILNGLALIVLVVALHARQRRALPGLAAVARAIGLIWAALVIGAGMVANIAVERAAYLAPADMDRAANLWETLHLVELGLGGGNEIAGGVWIGCVSLAGLWGRSLGKMSAGLGILTSASGLLTLIPALGDVAGAGFGLGAIAWFICAGLTLLRNPSLGMGPAGQGGAL